MIGVPTGVGGTPVVFQAVELKDGDTISCKLYVPQLVTLFLRGVIKSPLPNLYRVKKGRGQRRFKRNRAGRAEHLRRLSEGRSIYGFTWGEYEADKEAREYLTTVGVQTVEEATVERCACPIPTAP